MTSTVDAARAVAIPSELTGPVPRRVRITGAGICIYSAAAAFLVFAVFCAYRGATGTVRETQHRAALRDDGVKAVGEITRLREGKNSETVYYTFSANGTSYSGLTKVPDYLRGGFRSSTSLPIRYLPADPAVNHPAEWEWVFVYWHPLDTDLIHLPGLSSEFNSLLASLMSGAFGLFFLAGPFMERKLLVEGKPAIAVVTKCTRGSRGGNSFAYEFRTEDGRTLAGRYRGGAMEVGASLCILYLPQTPERNGPCTSQSYSVAQ